MTPWLTPIPATLGGGRSGRGVVDDRPAAVGVWQCGFLEADVSEQFKPTSASTPKHESPTNAKAWATVSQGNYGMHGRLSGQLVGSG